MSTASLADGTKLYADPAGGTSYAELVDVHDITAGYEPAYAIVDITPLAVGSTKIRNKKVGLGEPGRWSFKQFWTAARDATLDTPYSARTTVAWRVELPDTGGSHGTYKTFSGVIVNKHLEGLDNPDSPILIVCEVQTTGAVTTTVAA